VERGYQILEDNPRIINNRGRPRIQRSSIKFENLDLILERKESYLRSRLTVPFKLSVMYVTENTLIMIVTQGYSNCSLRHITENVYVKLETSRKCKFRSRNSPENVSLDCGWSAWEVSTVSV
jgi:hypothetical protein